MPPFSAVSEARQRFWFSPSVASRRYGLTDIMGSKAFRELEKHQPVVITREVTGRNLSQLRTRNTYSVNLDRLRQVPVLDDAI